MAKKKHIKLTEEQKKALELLKIDAGARRKAAVEAGEYDGRFRPRKFKNKKKYDRKRGKRVED